MHFAPRIDQQGATVIPGESRTCPNCSGKGTVRKSGSDRARELIFEATGVLGSRALIVQQSFVHITKVQGIIEEFDP